MFGNPGIEGGLNALLAGGQLIEAKRGADEIGQRAGWLLEGFAERRFLEPKFGRVQFVREFVPLIFRQRFARHDFPHGGIGVAQFLNPLEPSCPDTSCGQSPYPPGRRE